MSVVPIQPAQPAPRVVIIDDTEDLRDLLRLALMRDGFDVVGEAGDGSDGVDLVRDHQPDLVLLDLAMPVMNGIAALPAIRRVCLGARVVVLSGFGADQHVVSAVAAGADGYVQKGAPLGAIVTYVRDLLAEESPSIPTRALTIEHEEAALSGRASITARRDALRSSGWTTAGGARPRHVRGRTDVVASGSRPADASIRAIEAVARAPFGVLELADEPLLRIVSANAPAARLLGAEHVGSPLSVVAPELAAFVTHHRRGPEGPFATSLPGGAVRVSLSRTDWSVLVYLEPDAD
ncbi:response regulator [Nocardioides sp. R-C-SC26]|uniref:response regulator n=1 Tax=Nocardioides sp. R-C-SC26 TaxID=2870414 RepID=UPI001E3B4268|nr:response regulator [Nocardioides sp. R-C-SC26]